MISCENCDRDIAIKAFCYFSRNPYLFYNITGRCFDLDTFAEYAIDAGLRWKFLPCSLIPRSEFVFYWKIINPFLVEAYRAREIGCPPAMSKIYIDYLLLICDTRDSE